MKHFAHLFLILCAGVLVSACEWTMLDPIGDPEEPQEDTELLEFLARTPLPLMSLEGTTWVWGDFSRMVNLDERGIIIPPETPESNLYIILASRGPFFPEEHAWSFQGGIISTYYQVQANGKSFYFRKDADSPTDKPWQYALNETDRTLTFPESALPFHYSPFKLYVLNPSEMILLEPFGRDGFDYISLTFAAASSEEQELLHAAPAIGDAGCMDVYEEMMAAIEVALRKLPSLSGDECALQRELYFYSHYYQGLFGLLDS